MTTYRAFERNDIAASTEIWNAACGASLHITPRFFEYNTRPTPGVAQAGRVAMRGGEVVGVVLASAPQEQAGTLGWFDVIAVAPSAQRQGIGAGLLDWACGWLRERGCKTARLGSSLRPFAPGSPAELNNAAYFIQQGFTHNGDEWDLAADLAEQHYPAPTNATFICRPAQTGDVPAMHEFFARAFPGRWQWEFSEFLREEGHSSDYMLLFTKDRPDQVEGFCRMTLAESERPLDRFYLNGLPKPWGQVGSVGVSAEMRGRGYGYAVVAAALAHLKAQGIRGCVIDWTDLLDFYARFGFKPFRQYAMLSKQLLNNLSPATHGSLHTA